MNEVNPILLNVFLMAGIIYFGVEVFDCILSWMGDEGGEDDSE